MGTNKINRHRHADYLKEQQPPEMGSDTFAISKEYHCLWLHCLQLPHGKRCAFKHCIKRLMYYIKQFVKHSSSSSQTLSSLWRCLVKQKSLNQKLANTVWPNISQTKRLTDQTFDMSSNQQTIFDANIFDANMFDNNHVAERKAQAWIGIYKNTVIPKIIHTVYWRFYKRMQISVNANNCEYESNKTQCESKLQKSNIPGETPTRNQATSLITKPLLL